MSGLSADFISAAAPQKAAPKIVKGQDVEKTRAAVEDFEAFFISQTFQLMYDTVPVNETFGGGNAEKIFRSMMIDEYGKMTAKSGGIGLTNQIMAQLLQQQEAASTTSPKTDCPGPAMSREEIEGVGFIYGDLNEMLAKYPIDKMKDGWNTLPSGEEVYYISNPALGLWAHPDRFKD